jgi:hypothetical protein
VIDINADLIRAAGLYIASILSNQYQGLDF